MAKWTAEDWDRSESAEEMLRNAPPLKRRKCRLFSVALCNRFRQHVSSPDCLAALAAAERDAEKPLNKDDLRAIRVEADAAARGLLFVPPPFQQSSFRHSVIATASRACAYSIHANARVAALGVSRLLVSAACCQGVTRRLSKKAWQTADRAEQRRQADLLRHIVGNPYRPFPAPPPLPAAVVQLAVALEAGEPVAFALRDALLEAGRTELAEHFGGDEPHPRGCWALDVIGGRA